MFSASPVRARLAFGGIAVKCGLGLVRVFGKEGQEEIVRFYALAAGGFLEAAQDAVIFQPARSACAVDDFAQNDDRAQTALGLVNGRGYLGPTEAGEEVLLLRAQQAPPKTFGLRVAQGFRTHLAQLAAHGPFLGPGPAGPPRTLGELPVRLTGIRHPALDLLTKPAARPLWRASSCSNSLALVSQINQLTL